MKHLKKLICIILISAFLLAVFPACTGSRFSVSPSLAPGIYDAEQSLELTAPDARPVFYTTDGSNPVPLQEQNGVFVATGSTKHYTAPILIKNRAAERPRLSEKAAGMWEDKLKGSYDGSPADYNRGVVIKAAALRKNGRLGEVWTGSYFVTDNSASVNLPIMSISLPEACLFAFKSAADPFALDGGIYRYPSDNIEYTATFEFFGKDKQPVFHRDGGIRVSSGKNAGGAPMKSFNVNLKKGSSTAPVNVPIWGNVQRGNRNAVISSFTRFRLRNAGESYLTGGYNQVLAQSLADILAPANTSAVYTAVYLNGDFWGVYALEEAYSDDYIAAHYNESAENVIQIGFDSGCNNKPSVSDGDEKFATDSYQAMYNFAWNNAVFTDAVYEQFEQTYMDLDEYIDTVLAHIFFNCSDYPGNNNRMWRVHSTRTSNRYADGRWRPMLYDLDRAFSEDFNPAYDMFGHMLGEFEAPSALGGKNRNPEWSTLFFRRLWTNAKFRARLAARAQYFHDTLLSETRVSEYVDRIYGELAPTQGLQSARWSLSVDLEQNRDGYKSFIAARKTLVMAQLAQRIS